jgi:hypothetical protein
MVASRTPHLVPMDERSSQGQRLGLSMVGVFDLEVKR